jgi:RNA-directed DNA polymerase
LLDRLKYPPHFHGGIKRHSVATNALPHTRKLLVAKFDIKSFYPNTSYKSVYKAFIHQGCAPQVARILTQLTTADGHLPQGFLTSPKVSCLVLWNINRRLTSLFKKHNLDHTIWIDDLTVSGSYPIQKLEPTIIKIFQSEGFEIKASTESTYTYRHERQNVTGVGVNSEVVAPKNKIARLSAIKHAIDKYGTSGFLKRIGDKNAVSQLKQNIQGDISLLIAINRRKYREYYDWFRTESKKDAWR